MSIAYNQIGLNSLSYNNNLYNYKSLNDSFNSSIHLDNSSNQLNLEQNIKSEFIINENTITSTDESIDNSFIFYILILILILWNLYGFFIQIKLLFFTSSKESNNQFFDNCSITSSYFKYMIRLKYTDLINGYQLNNGTIMIDLLDIKDRFITRLTITPNWIVSKLKKNKSTNQFKTIKFKLNRKHEFPEIGSIKITHDSFVPDDCAIFIINLQIKDLTFNKIVNIPINRAIKALGPDRKFIEQMYEANKAIKIEPDEEMFNDGHQSNITINELLIFTFIYLNIIMMLILISKYYLTKDNKSINNLISTLIPNLIGFILLILIIKLYQRFIKEHFILKIGSNKWRLIRILFIIISLNFSILMNLISFWLIIQINENLDKLFLIYSFTFTIVSILLLILIYRFNQFKINRNLKSKERNSLTMISNNQITKEKQNLKLNSFILKENSSKEKSIN